MVEAWNSLPAIPSDWVIWYIFLWAVVVVAGFVYSENFVLRAYAEGRVKTLFGQIPAYVTQRELWREARSGNKVACVILALNALLAVLFLVWMVWPKK